MSDTSEKKSSGSPKVSSIKERFKSMNGIDLSKFKSLSIHTKEKLKSAAASLYSDFSNYKIITIAGETVALGETGLLSKEKMLHDAKDFESLYIPEELKEKKDDLQELMIRMFALSGSSAKKQILPPKEDEKYYMLMKSLQHRLKLLQAEVVEANPSTLDAREKLAHFYRLKGLIESLMKLFKEEKGTDYEPVASESGKPPAKGEEKLPLTDEEAMRLLQLFGYVLLQAQHQLPGYKFPFSARGVVQQVQSLAIDEKGFRGDIDDAGLVIHPAIKDVLDPEEREKAILARILQSVQGVLEDFIEASGSEHIAELLAPLVDPDSEPTDIQSLVESLTDILGSLNAEAEKYGRQNGSLVKAIQVAEGKVTALEAQKTELEGKLRECEEKEKGAEHKESEAVGSLREKLDLLKESLDSAEQRLNLAEADARALRVKAVETSEVQSRLTSATEKIRRLQALLKEKDLELASMTDVIKALEAKEAEWDETHDKLTQLEKLESTTKAQEIEMRALRKELAAISKAKIDLEAQQEKLLALEKQLEEAVPDVANTNLSDKSEFEKFSARVLSLLPRLNDDTLTTISSTTGKRNNNTLSTISSLNERKDEDEEDEDPLNAVETPFDADYLIPSVLELKGKFVQNFCRFVPALDALMDDFLRTPEGEIIEQRLNKVMDQKLLYNLLVPSINSSTPETKSMPARLAEIFQTLLLYATDPKSHEATLEPHRKFLSQLALILNPVADELDANFKQAFTNKEIDWNTMSDLNRTLLDFKIKSYPIVFYLYLLSLRDWVTCLNEKLPTPVECPQIPPSLLRKEMISKCQTVGVV